MFADRHNRASDIASSSGLSSAAAILATSQLVSPSSPTSDLSTLSLSPSSASGASAATPDSQPAVVPTVPTASSAPRSLNVGADFNNDGQTDLLWRNYATGENVIWFMKGADRLSSASLTTVGDINWRIEGANDFNGDGKTDIVWRNYATGQNVIWLMDGAALHSSVFLTPLASSNWQIQGTADFTGDGKPDLLWRNYATGENAIWALNGTTVSNTAYLPSALGTNLRIQAAADFNRDGKPEILWRNDLSGETFIWSLGGTTWSNMTIASTTFLTTVSDVNWQIQGAGDSNNDGKTDIFWRNVATGQNGVWFLDDLKDTNQAANLPAVSDLNWRIALQDTLIASNPIKISNFAFSGQEGDGGTFKVELTQAPTTNVTLTFSTGSFVVVDADSTVVNGTQNTLTFTPQDWKAVRTVSFIAEADNSSADRLLGNTVSYTLSGGLAGSAVYELGKVTNTYAPDPTRFNIDLDFRNDPFGFWTPEHRAIAQKAANDWAAQIASEWTNFQLNSTISKLGANSSRSYSFTSKRYVDDLLIFLNPYQGNAGLEAANGGPDYEFGGWISSPDLMPRVGQIAINADTFSATNDPTGWLLYQVVTHEIGHVLGLVGLNWQGYNLTDRSTPQTAVFKGEYARAANGGNYVPLQAQNGANPVTGTYDYSHPADSVQSILSYGWLYRLYAPSTIDYAMLADSGYRVYGFNA
ncbi:FG-GAP repeat domain-containing protein [Stenomitos frigidus]|uniref:Uncharacterized protein n=1 Tax=Stenomitos frigidus ULC18 TaxID=2107698 RepID=A0A2T1DUD6_9CYAN|nr:VCBS repeat-containing protein [Stenomitos frigidus]PSB23984.1 hypothetical protein C7B82_28935 [Stenomitos frigidus ULC18]